MADAIFIRRTLLRASAVCHIGYLLSPSAAGLSLSRRDARIEFRRAAQRAKQREVNRCEPATSFFFVVIACRDRRQNRHSIGTDNRHYVAGGNGSRRPARCATQYTIQAIFNDRIVISKKLYAHWISHVAYRASRWYAGAITRSTTRHATFTPARREIIV